MVSVFSFFRKVFSAISKAYIPLIIGLALPKKLKTTVIGNMEYKDISGDRCH